jgi:hypothetical protein
LYVPDGQSLQRAAFFSGENFPGGHATQLRELNARSENFPGGQADRSVPFRNSPGGMTGQIPARTPPQLSAGRPLGQQAAAGFWSCAPEPQPSSQSVQFVCPRAVP